MSTLLAVDLGIRTGLALYGQDGRLRWFRSKNFGTAERLRRGVRSLLDSLPDISLLVLEGGGTLAAIWERQAGRRGIPVRRISAELWRRRLLYRREQLSGPQAKKNADWLARRIITWSGMSLPPSLRHDSAEAILIGLWAVMDEGWLENVPHELKR